MIKLLIVDDSALMRRLLKNIFEEHGGFELRTARNGKEAIELNRTFQPDVITLDINMPEMDGLTALSYIMVERPVPVVMFSSLTEKGALATFEALNMGAVDYVAKPEGTVSHNIDVVKKELIYKVKAAAKAKIKKNGHSKPIFKSVEKRPAPKLPKTLDTGGIVIIGVSTGGPSTLEKILSEIPATFPWPIVVVQHMPKAFTGAFAKRLDQICELKVVEAATPMTITPGHIYIAKGGADAIIGIRAGKLSIIPRPEDPKFLWHPSVEVLGRSVLKNLDCKKVIAVMLTGMGYDGADAFAEIKRNGGRTIAESEESAVVFGMPAELIKRGGATVVLPAEKIASKLIAWVK